jgi:hypothetical protein
MPVPASRLLRNPRSAPGAKWDAEQDLRVASWNVRGLAFNHQGEKCTYGSLHVQERHMRHRERQRGRGKERVRGRGGTRRGTEREARVLVMRYSFLFPSSARFASIPLQSTFFHPPLPSYLHHAGDLEAISVAAQIIFASQADLVSLQGLAGPSAAVRLASLLNMWEKDGGAGERRGVCVSEERDYRMEGGAE